MRVAIVGAGIMGRMLAWRLLGEGLRPEIFDRDPQGHGDAASWTAAGMLAPGSELESAEDLIYRMGVASLRLWADLPGELGRDLGFRAGGTLVVAHGQDRADLSRFRLAVEGKLGEGKALRALDRGELSAVEPELAAGFGEALHLPGEACVDNVKVMHELGRALRGAGVQWHEATVVDHLAPGRLWTGGREYRFDWVVDCRGMGAKEDLSGLRGVRGELLQVHAPGVEIRHMVRLMHPRYRLYLVPGADNTYLLGATQIESEDYSPLSVRSAMELLSALYTLHREFAEARIIGSRSNCRPALPDNLPLLGHQAGLLAINGLFRHGFLLAPLLAREAAALVTGAKRAPAWPEIHEDLESREPTCRISI